MTLRKRLLWLFIPLVVLTLLIVNSLSRHLLLSRFDAQDELLLSNEARILAFSLENALTRNLDILRSYAWWDDSYDYAQGIAREKFARRNLDPDSLITLDFDFLIYFDVDGQVIGEQWVPPDMPELFKITAPAASDLASLRQAIIARSGALGLLAHHDNVNQATGQFVLVQGIPLMLIASPISNNQGTAVPLGNVLAGRFLDLQRMGELNEQVNGRLRVLPVERDHPGPWRPLADAIHPGLQHVSIGPRQLLNEQQNRIELLLSDVRNEPQLRLQITRPREVYAQGKASIGVFLRLAIAVALVAILLVYLGLEHWVLSRIQRLHREVSGISGDTPLPRLSDHGHDELGQLAGELNLMLERLAQSEARDRVILDSISDGYFEIDAQGRITSVNRALLKQLGYKAEELIDRSFRDVLSAEDVARAEVQMLQALSDQGTSSFTAPLHRRDGSLVYLETRFSLSRGANGELIGFRGILRDISDQVAYQNQLRDMAYRDPLTGLGNRKALDEQLRAALESASRQQSSLALLFIDLDHFKTVNDRFGHDVGDALLTTISERLRQTLRQPDRFYRIGGDEFIMLLPGTSREAAEKLAQRLLFVLNTPIEVHGKRIDFVTQSIGIALFPEHADNAEALLKAADSAMYQAKQAGRNQASVYRADQAPAGNI
ncbi:diguanylate cyclase [Pseudomonas sp. UL073]|uniref:Diguanylate cyclase n=1 Tax=Zestomonas insulae TaxID=2809017 RepID=A0ABS2IAF5_9GAMM|nr:diguanylate cyclase [Pseudomonas insulae]